MTVLLIIAYVVLALIVMALLALFAFACFLYWVALGSLDVNGDPERDVGIIK